MVIASLIPFATAGWSIAYLVLGVGLVGAILLFVTARLLGK